MRPIRLTLRAFGPYAGEQLFDFRELRGRSFFLIHGPTGSGKTTILDAMSFALYGDTSGNERDGKQMRSDMADSAFPTEVVFDFALGSETYRVARSPEQERPKQRGEGMTTERPKATLWRRTGLDEDDAAEGQVLSAQWSDVTRTAETLLGFKSDQFRQVVLLPQGQFRKLLLASSGEREEILEKLFQTDFYSLIAERLKEAAKDVQDRMKDARRRGEIVREQAGVESTEELETRRKGTDKRLEETRARVIECKEQEKKLLEALNRGRERNARFQERDAARQAAETLEARTEMMKQKGEQLARARRAAGLLDAERNLTALVKDAEAAVRDAEAAERALTDARTSRDEAQRRFTEEEQREPEREAARRDRTRLEELKAKVDELATARTDFDATQREAKDREKRRDAAKQQLEELQSTLESQRNALSVAEKDAARLEALEAAHREAETNLTRRRQLEDERKASAESAKGHEAAKKALDQAESAFQAAREELTSMEKIWAGGQAALLARGLEPGTPCPVCGSTDHPAPAHAEGEIPDEATIRERRAEVERLEADRDETRRKETELAKTAAEQRTRIEGLETDLGALASRPVDALESALADAAHSLEAAHTAAGTVEDIKHSLTDLENRRPKMEKTLGDEESALAGAVERRERARGRIEEREAGIPEPLRLPGALEKEKERAAEQIRFLLASFDNARESLSRASESVARCEEGVRNASEHTTATRARADAARVDFDRRLIEAGFVDTSGASDRTAFQTAKLDGPRIAALEQEIQSFHSALESARDRLKRAESALEGLSLPDLAALETAHSESRLALQSATEEQAALAEQLRLQDRWMADLRAVAQEVESLDREFGVVGRLADVANGRNARGINFQRFVLGALLDDVLVAASHRLTVMSKGRYTLQRQTDRADRRSAAGLDLEVFDAYTGIPRPVETLSGGESFLASLSLALGLADVVQAYSGGIHLETIFVDEGFGSLDPESLDLALRALIDLQKGGRLVGIISHVPELKDRIDARLEVLPDRRGSRARFVVP